MVGSSERSFRPILDHILVPCYYKILLYRLNESNRNRICLEPVVADCLPLRVVSGLSPKNVLTPGCPR